MAGTFAEEVVELLAGIAAVAVAKAESVCGTSEWLSIVGRRSSLHTMSDAELLAADAAAWALENTFLTKKEYLATEPARTERHEYIDGQIRAMAAASDSHEGVAGLLFALIFAHLRGKPCRVYKGDMKLRVQQRTQARKVIFYYPDIKVVCDPTDNESLYKTKPKVIVEVLSHDKGRDLIEKLAVYPPSGSSRHDTAAAPQTSLWQKLRMALKLETLLIKRLFTGPSQAFSYVERSQPD